jgi:hypothetical protein
MKIRLTKLAEDSGLSYEEARHIVEDKLCGDMTTGSGRSTWIDEEGQDIFNSALDVPEVIPKHHRGIVWGHCRNPNYMYVLLPDPPRKVAVSVQRKLFKKMKGKKVTIEEIKDINGSSYRHVRGD